MNRQATNPSLLSQLWTCVGVWLALTTILGAVSLPPFPVRWARLTLLIAPLCVAAWISAEGLFKKPGFDPRKAGNWFRLTCAGFLICWLVSLAGGESIAWSLAGAIPFSLGAAGLIAHWLDQHWSFTNRTTQFAIVLFLMGIACWPAMLIWFVIH